MPIATAYGGMSMAAAGTERTGEVRFANGESAQMALQLNGSDLKGGIISVALDQKSKDGSKIIVSGIPASCEWQQLKEHFLRAGAVLYAGIRGSEPVNQGPVGTVKYQSADEAMQAVAFLNGSTMQGAPGPLQVSQHPNDPTKLKVVGLPPGCERIDLQTYFSQAGQVWQAEIVGALPEGIVLVGEVRYDNASLAQNAMQSLNGSDLGGSAICIDVDINSPNGTRLHVTNIPTSIQWQELKDHFSHAGHVAFVQIHQVAKDKFDSLGCAAIGKACGKGRPLGPAIVGPALGMSGPGQPGGPPATAKDLLMAKIAMWKNGAIGGNTMGGNTSAANALIASMQRQVTTPGGAPQQQMHPGATIHQGPTVPQGEVRFQNQMHCQMAVNQLTGHILRGSRIQVELDRSGLPHSLSKVCVTGLAPGTEWQEMKDLFQSIGPVAFARVNQVPVATMGMNMPVAP